eukprot:CAMPEP_0197709672 /NCGR_PEP_ID=MMETSP1338-20131121/128573_1 /TAXON_ID=43686 ORGANISM="Pelagodinium beii, Strain RCC1491" /NCGR_SAMPLE_ID=MMETSP1338 /ASSEMBLY_ACC=CAM_ASM_000754 /LENGTH=222 /DNA_ID=CAMNT_0043293607 /DNA_START=379 /DNA_END=1046 /DNA_ORIENTATION=-
MALHCGQGRKRGAEANLRLVAAESHGLCEESPPPIGPSSGDLRSMALHRHGVRSVECHMFCSPRHEAAVHPHLRRYQDSQRRCKELLQFDELVELLMIDVFTGAHSPAHHNRRNGCVVIWATATPPDTAQQASPTEAVVATLVLKAPGRLKARVGFKTKVTKPSLALTCSAAAAAASPSSKGSTLLDCASVSARLADSTSARLGSAELDVAERLGESSLGSA